MNKPVNKNDKIIRAALFLEYDGKCFYTGLPLRFQDMHIDHIIPVDKKNKDLEILLNELALPVDFSLDSLYNLVPCVPNANQVKNKKQYPPRYLAHCIYMNTAPKIESLRKRIEIFKKEYELDKNLARLTAKLNNFNDKKELEKLYNYLSNEKSFNTEHIINKSPFGFTYKYSLSNVSLVGHIPMYPNLKGSCLITFSNLRLRDCMITLDHTTIMKSLFQGINTKLSLNLRDFILHSSKINKDTYYVDLSNTRIPLEKEEVEQLIKIIDDFASVYLNECKDLYLKLNKNIFENSDDKSLRLFKIPKSLWFKLMSFCWEFDYQKGDSKWHIFDSSGSFIKIFDKEKSEFRAFIIPERESNKFLISNSDDVWLVWTDEFFWEKSLENIEAKKIWSPLFTYNWLTEEFIPYVIYHNGEERERNFLRRKISANSFEGFQKNFNIRDYSSYLPTIKNNDYTNLLSTISDLQTFYSTHRIDYYNTKNLKNLYKSLIIILQKSNIDQSGLNYIGRTLNISNKDNKETIIHNIENTRNTVTNGRVCSGYEIDLIFRTMLFTLTDYTNHLSKSETGSISVLLTHFLEVKLTEEVRKRF
jgi:hypothetical protein